MTNFTRFDAADYLDSHEAIKAYLNAALEEDNPEVFIASLKTVARARGLAQPGAHPRYETVHNMLHELGVSLQTGTRHTIHVRQAHA